MEPIRLGALTLYPFGLILAGLLVLFFAFTAWQMKKHGLKAETASWFVVLAVPLCFVLARLFYCLMIADVIIGESDYGKFFRFGEGGFLLWGAIAGLLLAAGITGKITGQSGAKIADTVVFPAFLMIAAIRLVCGLVITEFGIGAPLETWFSPEETDFTCRFSVWALEDWSFFERFPFAVMNYYDTWCWAIFSLQTLWAAAAAFMVRGIRAAEGGKAVWFVVLHACGAIVTECMLIGGEILYLPWQGFVKANEIISAAALIVVLAVCLRRLPKGQRLKSGLLAAVQFLCAIGIIIAMEFAAFEKKLSDIAWLPADACHLLVILACLWIALAFRSVWKKAYPAPDKA
ncbi:MAG: prolipoprotein diacylglyceryl transferase [Clostridia bacterium]|nr:prolipoprotein diacylglyceryl transferase [Clostridia bacterium]